MARVPIRILGEDDTRGLIGTDAALDLAREILRTQDSDGSRLSSPSGMDLDATAIGGPRFKVKGATVGHLRASGIRIIAHRPDNTGYASSTTAVYDHTTGAVSGLVSDIGLSRLRTAAFGVASAELLVNPGPLVVGVFGAGDVAAELMPMLARAFDIAEVCVISRRPERTAAFVERFTGMPGLPIRAVSEAQDVVVAADLVFTVTDAPSPLIQDGWLKAGAVVCSMGRYNEVAFEVLASIDRLVVDDSDYASTLGDGGAWIRQGALTRASFEARIDAPAADIAAGRAAGRLAASDRILALIQGVAIGDVAFAVHALQAAEASYSRP